jgi:alpha-tubulin suppressor-like RCC1 family protein
LTPACSLSTPSCFLSTVGEVFCAGNNEQLQLGQLMLANNVPPPGTITAPVKVPSITDAISIAAARNFTCAAMKSTGQVKCWGGAWLWDGVGVHLAWRGGNG